MGRSSLLFVVLAAVSLADTPNFTAQVSRDLLQSPDLPQSVQRDSTSRDSMMGLDCTSKSHLSGTLDVLATPTSEPATFVAKLKGEIKTNTVGTRRAIEVKSHAISTAEVTKQFYFDATGFHTSPANAKCESQTHIDDVTSDAIFPGFVEELVRRFAERRNEETTQLVSQKTAQQLEQSFEKEFQSSAASTLAEANQMYREKLRDPLLRLNAFPKRFMPLITREGHLRLEILQEGGQPTPESALARPPSQIQVQMHDSAVRNTTDRLLGGKMLLDEDFEGAVKLITGEVPRDLRVFEGTPRWKVLLAQTDPLLVGFDKNRVRIALNAQDFEIDGATLGKPVRIEANLILQKGPQAPSFYREGPILISETHPTFTPFIRKKFEAIFAELITFDGIGLPGGAQFERLQSLKMKEALTNSGWLLLEWDK